MAWKRDGRRWGFGISRSQQTHPPTDAPTGHAQHRSIRPPMTSSRASRSKKTGIPFVEHLSSGHQRPVLGEARPSDGHRSREFARLCHVTLPWGVAWHGMGDGWVRSMTGTACAGGRMDAWQDITRHGGGGGV